MDSTSPTLATLFEQLGLPADPAAIDGFIAAHRPLPAGIALSDAPFWTRSQSRFLCEGIAADADWAEVVDALNLALRG
jgi:hypothetical protein